jgi:hypothetical protein
MMIADGLPAAAIIPPAERSASWKLKPAKPAKPQETTMIAIKTTPKKPTKNEQRVQSARKADKAKKTAKAKARTPATPKTASGPAKVIRPGSKLETVVGLLTRKEGCTAADVLKATDWPAVSMPQQARAAGLTLRQEKDGKVTRYWGT